jgi:hypothetical protein
LTIADFTAMEYGYWDERADNEEGAAFHTMHNLAGTVDLKKNNLSIIDFMPPWVADWKNYRAKGVSADELAEAMALAKQMTIELNKKAIADEHL